MEHTFESNFDKVIEAWRIKFLDMDHEALARRFGLKADEQALYLTYFHDESALTGRMGQSRMRTGRIVSRVLIPPLRFIMCFITRLHTRKPPGN